MLKEEELVEPIDSSLRYGLSDKLPFLKLVSYSIQHLTFCIANAAILPVVVGAYLGLDQAGLAALVQRTFILCGLVSIFQVLWGHKYPVFEGPAGMWFGVFITLATSAPLITDQSTVMDYKSLIISIITIGLMMLISLKAKGFLQSVAILIGAAVGWVLAVIFGIAPSINQFGHPVTALTGGIFPWGTPTFDLGITITFVIAANLLFSNLVASIVAFSSLTRTPLKAKLFNRGATFNGVSDIVAGLGSVIGFIPYASSTGFTSMTGVASRKPFIIGVLLMMILGSIPSVGAFFASLPPTVGYSVMFVVYGLILGLGVKEFTKIHLSNREMLIIGFSMIIGIGTMFLSTETFNVLPPTYRYLLLNGLVNGAIMCILLEHVILNEKLENKMMKLFRWKK